jgi:hypothetical protein
MGLQPQGKIFKTTGSRAPLPLTARGLKAISSYVYKQLNRDIFEPWQELNYYRATYDTFYMIIPLCRIHHHYLKSKKLISK